MTLRHMKILVAVYQSGSVTRAAEALHLSQPSVSLAIRELEDYYGVELFTRMGRRIVPTECGKTFYSCAVHVVSLMDELETRMRNWDTVGTVRIGATIAIGTNLLPGLVKRFQGEFPELKVEIQVCRASQVEQLILDNRIDLGLIEAQPLHKELRAIPFLTDELRAVLPPDSPLAGKDSVTIEELAAYPMLMREPGSAGRTALEAALALRQLHIEPAWESVSTQALIKAVAEGLGVAVLPTLLVERDAESGAIAMRPFREPLLRTLNVVYHPKKYLSGSMVRFIALCQALGEKSRPAP